MIKFTPKQHDDSQVTRSKGAIRKHSPSKYTLNFILGYAAALSVQSTEKYGKWDILLN